MKKGIFIIVLLTLMVVIGLLYYYSVIDTRVKMTKLSEIEVDKQLKGDYWHMVDEKRIEYLKIFNIDQNTFSLKDYNIIIAEGREIKQMYYKREKSFPFRKTYFTMTVMGKNLYPNRLFIYKIDKDTKVQLDEKGYNIDINIQN